jgi:hypothetical protein
MDGGIKRRGLLTVSAEAREWMQRSGCLPTPQKPLARWATWGEARRWSRVETQNAKYAGRDHYEDCRARFLLDCRIYGEDATMRSVEECEETWLIDREYVPAPEGRLERALREAFRWGWDMASDS